MSSIGSLDYAPLSKYGDLRVESVLSPIEDSSQLRFDYRELRREIRLTEVGVIRFYDHFYLTNNGSADIRNVEVFLPKGIYALSAHDTIGVLESSIEQSSIEEEQGYSLATISLRTDLKTDEATRFSVIYQLTSNENVEVLDLSLYKFRFVFSEFLDLELEDFTISVVLPEGARILDYSEGGKVYFDTPFQERVSYESQNFVSSQVFDLLIAYEYQFFWVSFRPTLWIGLLILSVYMIRIIPRYFKPQSTSVQRDNVIFRFVKDYVDAFEEKEKTLLELKSIDDRSRKKRLPKRQLERSRSLLKNRVSTLSNNMDRIGDRIKATEPRYANVMREIEISETELAGVEAEIERIRRQYRRRKLSSAAYRQLLKEYNDRREKIKGTVKGILLRLREAIS